MLDGAKAKSRYPTFRIEELLNFCFCYVDLNLQVAMKTKIIAAVSAQVLISFSTEAICDARPVTTTPTENIAE